MQVKGMEIPAYDPRGAQGMALAYATSNRGGCHMRAYMIMPEILGHPVFLDRFSTAGKPEIVALFQDISAVVDSTVLCRFLQFAMGISTFTEMLRVVTGLDFSDEELMTIGRRIYTLERMFNNRAGFGRADDTLPPRFFQEEFQTGSSRHRVVRLDGNARQLLLRARLGRRGRAAAGDPGGARVVNWPGRSRSSSTRCCAGGLGAQAIEIESDESVDTGTAAPGGEADRAKLSWTNCSTGKRAADRDHDPGQRREHPPEAEPGNPGARRRHASTSSPPPAAAERQARQHGKRNV